MSIISVIVPFYNAEPYIQRCIAGLLAQQYPRDAYEIIMVDNNSTDASVEIVKQHPHITLVTEHKQGAYAARNCGVATARGSIIAFTDPDCVPDPHWLQQIATVLSSAKDVAIVLGYCQMARATHGLSLLEAYEHQKLRFIFSSGNKDLYFGYTNNMAVRRDIFSRFGPFIERARGADRIFVRQVAHADTSGSVRYDASIRVRHLEIASTWNYYQKQFIYGQSNRLCQEFVIDRPLSSQERWQIVRTTMRDGDYSVLSLGMLLFILSVGMLCYRTGWWVASWKGERKAETLIPASGDDLRSGDH
jgi:glycosyltransferase involved in cell wall biosynthesis